jgi:cellulose synthase/poly-beta-1,6-N-acetylglucosamine synthase-like glycosyltransferase
MLYNFFIHIWLMLNFITMVFCLYHLSVAAAAFRKEKAKPELKIEYHRFAAIIAARNEEAVIENLIESIKLQNYPGGLIDIIVVADNCDDDTAGRAERAGAIVFKRYNRVQVGKGYVVKFAFDKILNERDVYDAFCILDADNLVDRDFFMQMNRTFCNGSKVAQGYRDMKNPSDNWVSGCHSIFYWMENRFFDYARSELGLSAIINGTGFMVSRDYIKEFGFNMKTVTEDVELTMQCVINGEKVDWVPQAKVYDEQPTSFSQSMIQRSRWVSGFVQNAAGYFKPFISSIARKPSGVKIDMFMFIVSLPIMIVGAVSFILYLALGLTNIFDAVSTIINLLTLAVASAAAFGIAGYATVLLEGKKPKSLIKAILTYPIFNLTWVVIWFKCIFRHTYEWKPIVHARNISINEIETTHQK